MLSSESEIEIVVGLTLTLRLLFDISVTAYAFTDISLEPFASALNLKLLVIFLVI